MQDHEDHGNIKKFMPRVKLFIQERYGCDRHHQDDRKCEKPKYDVKMMTYNFCNITHIEMVFEPYKHYYM